ncbi:MULTISPECIES: hypothetical protein [Prochlorococcus]|nr:MULTISPECIES: hypothetical protein [Prochlorococcus]KGG11612.1 hypothetical protein EV05_1979 [Prochlorococcus sp. MIT 0601]
MIPEIFQSPQQVRHLSLWGPVVGMIILFFGMNMRIEFHIQREEKEDEE